LDCRLAEKITDIMRSVINKAPNKPKAIPIFQR